MVEPEAAVQVAMMTAVKVATGKAGTVAMTMGEMTTSLHAGIADGPRLHLDSATMRRNFESKWTGLKSIDWKEPS